MSAFLDISSELPVLIAGPTASGKSSLALEIARLEGGEIINADALQVYDGWRLLTARPGPEDEATCTHHLYGHVPFNQDYSVGAWLRDISALLNSMDARPIIVGGTGLYFRALTEGLAEIPITPPEVRAEASDRMDVFGLQVMLDDLDDKTRARIDVQNPMRVQRAWEVLRTTGRGLADWQDDTPSPVLPLDRTFPIVMDAEKHWLNARIEQRFHRMIDAGALDEARTMLPHWNPDDLSSKAIGAAELIAHLQGEMTLDDAIEAAVIASRRYAKRQRTWFRTRMQGWHRLTLPT